MFERYTEKARRVIFFARYEANCLESPFMETEHLLLGLLREDKALAQRFLHSDAAAASIREKIQALPRVCGKSIPGSTSTSPDPPLAWQSKRVLANAAIEADNRGHRGQMIAPEHILLGLLREEDCLAAELLHEYGLNLASVTDELEKSTLPPARNEQWQRLNFTLKAVNPKLAKGTAAKPGYYHDGGSGDHGFARRVRCENMTMAEFAGSLPLIAPGYIRGGTVVDATGLEGAWNFTLNFNPATAQNVPGTGTLFEALEDQLGLRLEKSA